MASIQPLRYREATSADAPAMAQCRLTDPAAGAADPRISAYFEGRHHPQQALLPRVGFVACDGDTIVGYVAGHRTQRFGYEGEVQYLFVAPEHRRRGVATALLRRLAEWFRAQGVAKVCVDVDVTSPGAQPFYARHGAEAIDRYWYGWQDIGRVLREAV